MLRHSLLHLLCCAGALVALPVTACGEEAAPAGAVRIVADQLAHEGETDTLTATGNVEIRWDGATLTADRAAVREETGEAEASGAVQLRRDDTLLKSDRLSVNYETEQGQAQNADIFVGRGNFHLRGKTVAKVGENEYRVERGAFTTCDGPDPSWHFTAEDLDVTVDGFARGTHAVFFVGQLPLFYAPYIVFPVKQERQSGFLFPRIGSSTKKGFSLDVPWYWAISPSQDATIDVDIETRRGVGLGTEYRYLARNESRGTLREYLIYDSDRNKVRGDLTARQALHLTPAVDFKTDLHFVLDRSFYRDFAETAGEYNRQILDSSVSIARRWDSAVVTAEARYFEDLYSLSNDRTLQRLPILSAAVLGNRVGDLPLYASLAAEFTNFQRDFGIQGQRVDLHPSLAFSTSAGTPLRFSLWGGYRERLYHAYGEGTGTWSIGLADAGATAATTFDRVYGGGWGDVQRLKHTLVPELSYNFVEEKDQRGLPAFDFTDRIPGGSLVTFSITNFLTGKILHEATPPEYRELLYLRLSEGYQLAGSRRELLDPTDDRLSADYQLPGARREYVNPTNVGRPFTDIRLETRVTPWNRVSLFTDSRFNPYDVRFSTASATVEMKDAEKNSLGLGYHYLRGAVDYVEGKLAVDLVKPFLFNYTGRYAVDGGRMLESYYAIEYKHQCWSVIISYRDRLDNREVMVNFSLAGIGALGPVKAF